METGRAVELSVGIVGAAGHTGGELCRLLINHPNVRSICPASRGDVPLEAVHPNLAGTGLSFCDTDRVVEPDSDLDVVFVCGSAGLSSSLATSILSSGSKLIDLGPDFRFSDHETFEAVYGVGHGAPELISEARCGIPEFNRDAAVSAQLISNPGCYVVTTLLGLMPLVSSSAGVATSGTPIHVNAVNGTTGGGSSLRSELMHANAYGSVMPYSLNGHRHRPEIELRLKESTGRTHQISLATAHGNFARGVFTQSTVSLDGAVSREELLAIYFDSYGRGADGEPFVTVIEGPRGEGIEKEYRCYADPANVLGSNHCHVAVDVDDEIGVARIVSVTDNLGKGAAGGAVQNMNIAFGFPEVMGLEQLGL